MHRNVAIGSVVQYTASTEAGPELRAAIVTVVAEDGRVTLATFPVGYGTGTFEEFANVSKALPDGVQPFTNRWNWPPE
jgi:hypothetical protein